jgi:hypothetical protein
MPAPEHANFDDVVVGFVAGVPLVLSSSSSPVDALSLFAVLPVDFDEVDFLVVLFLLLLESPETAEEPSPTSGTGVVQATVANMEARTIIESGRPTERMSSLVHPVRQR